MYKCTCGECSIWGGTFKVTQNDMEYMECLRLLPTELNEGQRAEAREFCERI